MTGKILVFYSNSCGGKILDYKGTSPFERYLFENGGALDTMTFSSHYIGAGLFIFECEALVKDVFIGFWRRPSLAEMFRIFCGKHLFEKNNEKTL